MLFLSCRVVPNIQRSDKCSRTLSHLSTLNNQLADAPHEHVFSLAVFLTAAEPGDIYQNHQLKQASDERGCRRILPQEVEVLQSFSRIRGLKLAGVQHEQADEVEAPHHRGVAGLLTHCRDREGEKFESSDRSRRICL